MRRWLLASLVWVSLAPCQTCAQEPPSRPATSPIARPAVSPYLNMFRGGSPAINYYGIVRPQQDTSAALQRLQQQVAPAPLPVAPSDALLTTGHATRFMNYSHYFNNGLGSQGTATGYGVAAAGVPYGAAPSGGALFGGAAGKIVPRTAPAALGALRR